MEEGSLPEVHDIEFQLKIAANPEFGTHRYLAHLPSTNGLTDDDDAYTDATERIAKHADELANAKLKMQPHQTFVKTFLSPHTPYHSMLLFHGVGTGKTCTAMGVSEANRSELKQRCLVVAPKTVHAQFHNELFDESKLQGAPGHWVLPGCLDIHDRITPTMTREEVIQMATHEIRAYYHFLDYDEFSHMIQQLVASAHGTGTITPAPESVEAVDEADDVIEARNEYVVEPAQLRVILTSHVKRALQQAFAGYLIVMDEAHHGKQMATWLECIVRSEVVNLRWLFLTATPMDTHCRDMVWLVNLMNMHDGKPPLNAEQIFAPDGSFCDEAARDQFAQKSTGYISFVRGENPFTFPYRAYPQDFAPDDTHRFGARISYPHLDFATSATEFMPTDSDASTQLLQLLKKVYVTPLPANCQNCGRCQTCGYRHALKVSTTSRHGVGYQKESLSMLLNALLITYPTGTTGAQGLRQTMEYAPDRYVQSFAYKNPSYRLFAPEQLGTHSVKMAAIVELLVQKQSRGIVLVYSQFLEGGLIPMALALEELGLTRYHPHCNLFRRGHTAGYKASNGYLNSATYALITGNRALSPDNRTEIAAVCDPENMTGARVKVVLISRVGAEGIDFKNIRQVHVLDPWHRVEQIIGRAVRTFSHKALPFVERNVEIYLHATRWPDNQQETADLYLYRQNALLAMRMGVVTRLLKQVAVDCVLHYDQTQLTHDQLQWTVQQRFSSGKVEPRFRVGDAPYSYACDYMDTCAYDCGVAAPPKPPQDRFQAQFMASNVDRIQARIRWLFRVNYYYHRDALVLAICTPTRYPLVQIYAALAELMDMDSAASPAIVDKYGLPGKLVQVDDYVLFQPTQHLSTTNVTNV